MDYNPSPLYNDVSQGPADCSAFWVMTDDKVKIRVGLWRAKSPIGTVFICPGRSEYIEKYGKTAKLFTEHGYTSVSLDWRGQGLADRLTSNTLLGHVDTFSDYLKDLESVIKWAHNFELPKPWFVLGHSMGGAIILRALHQNKYFDAVAFSCPMWGIKLSPALRIFAFFYGNLSKLLKADKNFAPSTSEKGYFDESFADNPLTNDHETWQYLLDQVNKYPSLKLGGPSVRWVHSALKETFQLSKLPSPKIPCITFLAEDERIVDPIRVRNRMEAWSNGELNFVPSARHEVLMEDPTTQKYIVQKIVSFFQSNVGLITS